MSTRYNRADEVPTETIVSRLRELSRAISTRDRSELTMRIPVEVDRDADIVLSEAANRLERMTK